MAYASSSLTSAPQPMPVTSASAALWLPASRSAPLWASLSIAARTFSPSAETASWFLMPARTLLLRTVLLAARTSSNPAWTSLLAAGTSSQLSAWTSSSRTRSPNYARTFLLAALTWTALALRFGTLLPLSKGFQASSAFAFQDRPARASLGLCNRTLSSARALTICLARLRVLFRSLLFFMLRAISFLALYLDFNLTGFLLFLGLHSVSCWRGFALWL